MGPREWLESSISNTGAAFEVKKCMSAALFNVQHFLQNIPLDVGIDLLPPVTGARSKP